MCPNRAKREFFNTNRKCGRAELSWAGLGWAELADPLRPRGTKSL